MANHLLIVSGGTGGKIVRAFKKTVYQQFRSHSPNNIEYLYIDSSGDEMSKSTEWEVLGESIALGTSNFLELKSDNLATKFAEIERYPGVKDFVGNKQDWIDLINDARGQKTAGMQRRRMGRILYASNAKEFNNALTDRVRKLQSNTKESDVTFHVCAGLAGGTGSGSIIDIVTQIRNAYPANNTEYTILLYVYLPEDTTNWNTELDFYHANGYAALLELNALSTGALRPFDVTGEKGQLSVDTPFTGCYVFTNQNENGITVNKETELPEIVADFIYQKTIGLNQISAELHRIESGENGDPTPEMATDSKIAERSKRFLSFGIKRIAIPEQEIREYLTFNFAKQAALQLRFNNWIDVSGFVESPKNINFNSLVQQVDKLDGWNLSLKHLTLSEAVLIDDSSRRWKSFEIHWRDKLNFFKPLAKQKVKKEWIDALKLLALKEYEEDFRKSNGVVKFFEAKRKDKRDMAREIRRKIEAEFFEEWRNGDLSIYDLGRKINALIDYIRTDILRSLEDKIDSLRKLEERAKELIRLNDQNWAKIGIFSDLLNKRDEIFEAQVLAIQDEYRIRTEIDGLKFAREFVPEILEQLDLLNHEIITASGTVNDVINIFEQNILSRCNDQEWTSETSSDSVDVFKQQLVPFYESSRVKAIVRRFNRDQKVQGPQTAKVREALTKVLGNDRLNFVDFNHRLQKNAFATELEKVCQENAMALEKDLANQERLLGMNVIEKLQRHYEGNKQALRNLAGQLMKYAGCYVLFNQNEISKSGEGLSTGAAKRTLFVILPKNSTTNYSTFIGDLKEAFEFNKSSQIELKFLEADTSEYRITLMTVTSLFPLRYLTQTERLRDKYNMRLQKHDAIKAKMLLHIQDDCIGLPNLFAPTQQELADMIYKKRISAVSNLLLAHAMGLVKEKETEEGYKKLALVKIDMFGDEDPVFFMDKSLSNSWKVLTDRDINQLYTAVQQERLVNYKHKIRKEELSEQIKNIIMKLKEEASETDYKIFKDSALNLINELQRDN
ncbi:tubulin-like doman-containing protein [Spirosoma sp. RP8]|uniref:Tubulin-like doman-containing protein n=1 Tax=Spirosoma liriopis TaxID=2937440 RepID=A0ABT0HUR9_9BACT|nr:tubulin-like doman-containing protein [Spirosoma liriopis]MCK8495898.1 tubulin-like doman-containing protein [Spirosoma liriopis]